MRPQPTLKRVCRLTAIAHFEEILTYIADYAICIKNSEYAASLELHKLYRFLPDQDAAQDGDLRIVDESGEDYLYPANYFVLVEFSPAVKRRLNQSFACPAS